MLTGSSHGEKEPKNCNLCRSGTQHQKLGTDFAGEKPNQKWGTFPPHFNFDSRKSLGNPAVELATQERNKTIAPSGTNKNTYEVLGKVEPQSRLDEQRKPSMWVGCSVIAARRMEVFGAEYSDPKTSSEHTNRSKVWLDAANRKRELWKSTPWNKLRRNLFRLQMRVYKAIRAGDKRKAKSLQKLILKSYAARMLAIRQVTQLNAGNQFGDKK